MSFKDKALQYSEPNSETITVEFPNGEEEQVKVKAPSLEVENKIERLSSDQGYDRTALYIIECCYEPGTEDEKCFDFAMDYEQVCNAPASGWAGDVLNAIMVVSGKQVKQEDVESKKN